MNATKSFGVDPSLLVVAIPVAGAIVGAVLALIFR